MNDCIPRELMPQVDMVDITGLRTFLLTHGVSSDLMGSLGMSVITMRQCVKDTKPATLTSSLKKKPLIISNDYELVDGNGRYLAYKKAGIGNVPALWCNAPFLHLLLLINHYPKTYTLFGGLQPSRE